MSDVDVTTAVQRVLDARAELERRKGVSAGDALIMSGLALGVLLSGDR